MFSKFKKIAGGMVLGLTAGLLSTQPSNAQQVTLKLIDGTLLISGKLVNFNGSSYIVQSEEFGEITVDSSKFSCISGECPTTPFSRKISLRPNVPVVKDFAIHGSNTIGAKLMPALIDGYAKSIQGTTKKILGVKSEEIKLILKSSNGAKLASIDLHSHGSGTSAPGLAKGKAQIGMSSRPIKSKEINILRDAGVKGIKRGGNENIVALDGLLVVVSPQNSLNALSLEQLSQIFSGQVTDWSQVGRSTPGPINVYSRDNASGTYDTFKSLVLKPFKVKLSQAAKRYESNPDLSDDVAKDPNGIGFTGFAYKRNAKALAISAACGITQQPTLFNVKTEEYPLSRRLYLYSTARTLRSPVARKVLRFALSDRAQHIIPSIGFINQSIHSLHFNNQGNRIASVMNNTGENFNMEMIRQFMKEFANASRLSVTFRFKTGSSQLSNKSQTDIHRFVKLLRSNKLAGKEVFLVGFSDNSGAFDKNKDLALNRALSIKLAVLATSNGEIDVENLKVRSYGELFPVSCNNSKVGLAKNRRVEVWVR